MRLIFFCSSSIVPTEAINVSQRGGCGCGRHFRQISTRKAELVVISPPHSIPSFLLITPYSSTYFL
ncbi:hypothetical protein K469DRAFT_276940 [Zopfia rhizophila CBS 207.26]|uniref:Uncharacterized protein n=1 Tax=Zopfia rhizophila CBS 207.26 TaxID=1314779 RepID=A0A6A6DNU6_9PEZI|nr:hypothetical protein K469DRAFT_276940 [Zopfia rhizophila CBS 207.26]